MVLGDGARDRGAACELISTDPAIGAGVAFVRLEADPDPVRVRAGWVSDADIWDMGPGPRPSWQAARVNGDGLADRSSRARCAAPACRMTTARPMTAECPVCGLACSS